MGRPGDWNPLVCAPSGAGDGNATTPFVHRPRTSGFPPTSGRRCYPAAVTVFRRPPASVCQAHCYALNVLAVSSFFFYPQELGVDLDGNRNVKADTEDYRTSSSNVFAAGDMRRDQSLVVWAIQEGRECARAIDEFLDNGSVWDFFRNWFRSICNHSSGGFSSFSGHRSHVGFAWGQRL